MDRRTLLKGIIGVGAGLILPPTLTETTEAARRYWALGAIPRHTVVWGPFQVPTPTPRVIPLYAAVHWDDGSVEHVPLETNDLGNRWKVTVNNSRGSSFQARVNWYRPNLDIVSSYTTQQIPPTHTRVDYDYLDIVSNW